VKDILLAAPWLATISEHLAPNRATVLPVSLALLVVVALTGALLRRQVRPKPLMTRVEREVLGHLEAAVPWCRVHAQVCLGALLQPSRWLPRRTRSRQRYGYAMLIVDFVLDDRRTGDVVALVELDDRYHDRARDRDRDRLTSRAGYLTIRLPASEYPTRTAVLARVSAALNARNQQAAANQAARALHDRQAIASPGDPAKQTRWTPKKGRRA
jgi:very-short-patch-repair endonuclease